MGPLDNLLSQIFSKVYLGDSTVDLELFVRPLKNLQQSNNCIFMVFCIAHTQAYNEMFVRIRIIRFSITNSIRIIYIQLKISETCEVPSVITHHSNPSQYQFLPSVYLTLISYIIYKRLISKSVSCCFVDFQVNLT